MVRAMDIFEIPETSLKHCRSCNAPIFWGRTPKGKSCPFDWEPLLEGRYTVLAWDIQAEGKLDSIEMEYATETTPLDDYRYNSHFATCPQASAHSKKGHRGN